MKDYKSSALFALALIPVAALAAYFTILYQIDFIDAQTLAMTVEQLGSMEALIAVYIVQIVVYTLFLGFAGHVLARKLGLMRPIRFQKECLPSTMALSLAAGLVLALDYWTFGAVIPGIQEADAAMLNWNVMAASILYGGIVEEIMMRLFMMSLLAWLLWKLFFRQNETAPAGALIAANLISAMLFAAGHLPATAQMFGTLTPLILFRCFLLNGGAGLIFGWLYRKHGIQYAMLSHALAHIISKTIWFLFI